MVVDGHGQRIGPGLGNSLVQFIDTGGRQHHGGTGRLRSKILDVMLYGVDVPCLGFHNTRDGSREKRLEDTILMNDIREDFLSPDLRGQ